MNVIANRRRLIAALEQARREVCPYAPPGSCDCKYGLIPNEPSPVVPGPEATGCPELRDLIRMLESSAAAGGA